MSSSSRGWWRQACAWSVVALSLTACGGGSNPDSPTSDAGRQPAGLGQAAAAYLVTDSDTGLSGQAAHQLHLVNPDTGAVFKSIPVGTNSRYELGGAFTPSANGQGGTRGDASVLFFIRQYDDGQRQLFRTPLVGADAGVETRISNLTDACSIRDSHAARLDGVATWLVIEVAGVDRSCANVADNQFVFVRSDWGIGEPARVSPFGQQRVLVWEYNAQAELAWIYGYSEQYRALGAVNATTGQARAVANGAMSQPPDLFSPYPADGHKMLLRVGQGLRVLSWSNGDATLGADIATLGNPSVSFVAVDDQGVYFNDGLALRRIDPQGVGSVLATLSGTGAVQYDGAQTASTLLVVQGPAGGAPVASSSGGGTVVASTVPDTVLWAIPKVGGTARAIETWPGSTSVFVAGVSGETVVYGARTGTDQHGGFVTLKRVVANASAPVPSNVASGVRYLYSAGGTDVDFYGVSAPTHLLWCDVGGQANNCRPDRLRSYKLSTGDVLNIGSQSVPSGTPTWDLQGDVDQWDNAGRAVFEAYVQDDPQQTSLVRLSWRLKLDEAQSLKDIALP